MSAEELPDGFGEEENGDEFDELDALSEYGRFWNPRKPEKQHPHKLVLKAVRWEKKTSRYSSTERNVIVGQTKAGETWTVACDNLDLEPLYTGDVKRWNDSKKQFEVVDNWDRVREGEIFAVVYLGDRTYTNKQGQQVTTGSYRHTRKPPAQPPSDPAMPGDHHDPAVELPRPPGDDANPGNPDDDIPY